MREDRKTLFWPWIAALLIGLPVLYVASFGPACWLLTHRKMVPDTRNAIETPYVPLFRARMGGPPWVKASLDWWIEFWAE